MTPFLADQTLDVDAAIEPLPSNGEWQSYGTVTGHHVQQTLHLTQYGTNWLGDEAVA